jgi:hypothetical protein
LLGCLSQAEVKVGKVLEFIARSFQVATVTSDQEGVAEAENWGMPFGYRLPG